MIKNENMYKNIRDNIFSLDDIEASNLSPIKRHNQSEFDSTMNNKENIPINQIISLKYNYSNCTIKPLKKIKEDNNNDKKGHIKKNNSFNKIIQKEIILSNNSMNLNSKINKKNAIKTIPINTMSNYYYIKMNKNILEGKKPQRENRIKNIHISLKKIKLGNQQLSQNNNQETYYVHKSPKRKKTFTSERNYIHKENLDINNSYNNSKLLSKVNISAKKNNNLIPRPNMNYEIRKKKINRYNVMLGNKKIDKQLLDQSQEIKLKFKKENEIIKMKNEFFNKNGILPENKIDFENKVIKIQSNYRRIIQMKKLKLNKNKCNRTKICKVNEIIIFSQMNKKQINNENSLINHKYILKYLLLKKEQKRYNHLKKYFQQFKNQTKNNIKTNPKTFIKNENKINNINDNFELRRRILRDLINKKLNKNREILLRYFLQYYYNTFYIKMNWYIYYINLLISSQKSDLSKTSINTNDNDNYYHNSSDRNINIPSLILNENKNHLFKSFIDLKILMNKICETKSEELKKFYLNDIIRSMNKIYIMQEKIEKEKNLKNFALILFSKIKNYLDLNYNKFFYKSLYIEKINNDMERNDINKINYFNKIITKLQKKVLQKNFNKFILRVALSEFNKSTNNDKTMDNINKLNDIQINNDINAIPEKSLK